MEEHKIIVPDHIAIIMDGNGRWAKKRMLPRPIGHRAGKEAFRTTAYYCRDIGVKYLTVYAFSTENWKRPEEEKNVIMELMADSLEEAIEKMERDNIALTVFGDRTRLSPRIVKLMDRAEDISQRIKGLTIGVCIDYGGRAEIVSAIKKINKDVSEGLINESDIDEELVGKYLYTKNFPDPDLIIRPGGEMRISNFLMWQSAYSELYFTDTLWPDFAPADIDLAIDEYNRRNRRYGGL